MMARKVETAAPLSKLAKRHTRKPEDPFLGIDDQGLPYMRLTIDDDSPSHGITPGPFGGIDPKTGRSVMSSLAAKLNWNT